MEIAAERPRPSGSRLPGVAGVHRDGRSACPGAALLAVLALAAAPASPLEVPAASAQVRGGKGGDQAAPGPLAQASRSHEEGRDGHGLQGMAKVAIDIEMAHELPGLGIDAVEDRLERALAGAQPAPAIDPTSADRLQVTIAVGPVGSAELRGFYLPFSGHYAIGPVRLAVIRPVRIAGRDVPVAGIVWQAERLARRPWRGSGPPVLALLDDMLGEFLDDYRQAAAPR